MSTAAFSSFLLPTISMNKMCFSSSSSSSSSKNNNNNATSMISFSVKNLSRSCRVSMKLSDGSYDIPIDDVSLISYECDPIFDSRFDDPVYREALLGNDTFQCADDLEHLAPVVRRRVDAMRNIQLQHSNLEMEYDKELDLLEAKYEKLYQPFYTKRFELVNGIVKVPLAPDELNQVKGVPSFWLTAFKNNDDISKVITESDEEALKYLNDIKWCNIEEPLGFKLDFFFDTNPYFKDTVLTKSYQVITIEDKLLIEKAMGSGIRYDIIPRAVLCLEQHVYVVFPNTCAKRKLLTAFTAVVRDAQAAINPSLFSSQSLTVSYLVKIWILQA
ncbi:unnamed protein product [Cochlearia groenlandica]